MFLVRAVNQIVIELLCKSVDGCAKIPQNPTLAQPARMGHPRYKRRPLRE
jgi:hypothetical protein